VEIVSPHAPPGNISPPRFTLRDYQQDAVSAVLTARANGRERVLLILPTGAGKTIVFASIIGGILTDGGRALVLVHRDELLNQAVAKLRDVLGVEIDIGIVKAEQNNIDAQIVVASVQTLCRPNRLAQLGSGFVVCVIDEAHHAAAETYRQILSRVRDPVDSSEPAPFVLGVTATADRGDGVGLAGVFESIAYEKPMLELIEHGHLVDIAARQIAIRADFNQLHTRAGDFVDGETGAALLAAEAPAQVARAYDELARDRKGLVFTPTVAVAEAMADAFNEQGIPAASLDGTTPIDQRRHILSDLKSGAVQVVSNCGVLTEGFDEPSISCVTIAKPTKSRGHYTQMLGRGTRPYPGKTNLLVLDTVGCTTHLDLMTAAELFGLPTDALTTKTVSEAIATKHAAEIPVATPGTIISTTVNLFRQRPAHWVPTTTGRFALPTGDGTLVLRPQFGDQWDVLHVPRQGVPTTLVAGMTLGGAQGFAEDRAHQMGAHALVDRNAAWRSGPPSDKQLFALQRLGVPIKEIRTKGEASDAISAALVAAVA